jgi:hypothetical protein
VPRLTAPRGNVIIRYAASPGSCDYRAPIADYTAASEAVLRGPGQPRGRRCRLVDDNYCNYFVH